MSDSDFEVTVARVNESANKEGEFSILAKSISVSEDGTLTIATSSGGQTMAKSTWGAVSITRSPSAKARL